MFDTHVQLLGWSGCVHRLHSAFNARSDVMTYFVLFKLAQILGFPQTCKFPSLIQLRFTLNKKFLAQVKIVWEKKHTSNHEEITAFVESRYVSASKAFWRPSGYEMQMKSLCFVCMAVRPPNEQDVHSSKKPHDEAMENTAGRDTMPTAWFKLNASDPEANANL